MEFTKELLDQVNRNSLYTLLGIRIESVRDGTVRSRLDADPRACWPAPGQPHGGVLFTLMDTTMAWAAVAHPGAEDVATVQLDIQYLRPAGPGPLTCAAWTVHRTSRTCFLRAEVRCARGEPVAVGQGTCRTFGRRASQFVPPGEDGAAGAG